MTRFVPLALLFAFAALAVRTAADDGAKEKPVTAEDRKHWAFVPPQRPPVPKLDPQPANPIDAFVRARLEKAGLRPTPRADKLTLCRRLYLDLTGLPPTPAEVEAFLKDDAPSAYEQLVDRLLASPHYGERWATHWLDVVRFAESNGYETDGERPHAWRYRDYVVKSLNADKPYSQFVREQIAGDELAGDDGKEQPDLLVATGVHRCGPVHLVSGNLDAAVLRQEVLTEMVNGVGSAFMGLTFACCRCHDHKFDPLSAADYYRLQAFFAKATYADVDFAQQPERDARKKKVDELNAQLAPIKKQIADLDAPARARVQKEKRAALEPKFRAALDAPADKRTPEQRTLAAHANTLIKVSWDEVLAALPAADLEKRKALRDRQHALEAQIPPPTAAAWSIRNTLSAKTHVLTRGEPHAKAQEVQPGFARVLVSDRAAPPKTRRDLADWLTRPDHPLTARVMANRLWQYHFGRGIVATPNDFGTRGAAPTHPELLDWLATELVRREWRLKPLHKLIVTSDTYQQATSADHAAKADPQNKLLWRMSKRRLEAEAIRDSVLTAAGTLNRAVGGPSVKVPLEPEVYDLLFTEGEPDGLWLVTPDANEHARRSIYLFSKRNVRLPLFEAFDQPDTLNSCAVRPVSTYAPQALILMNSPFVHDQAKALAAALAKEVPGAAQRAEALYRRAVGRAPTADEARLALEFLRQQADTVRAQKGTDPEARALADLCVAVFNTHEFVYVP
jgi:hypothetical protein